MSKRSKATAIPLKVKGAVYDRDLGRCIFCGRPGAPNAHYIARSHGGMGVERNIVTACSECHHEMDNGKNTKKYKDYARNYLQHHYEDWNEDELIYRKGGTL